MLNPQFILPIAHELVVDLFAGGGGASTGIEQAIGRHVDIAINHDPEAVSLHQANHPQTQHYVSDVFEVDPLAVTDGRKVGLLWASPDCKHFSKAKGGKPVSKKIRGLAWVVVKWAKLVKPRIICLENVEEFQTWGPLGEDGRPCPERKGTTFQRWKRQLENLGYTIDYRELRACDFGAPTIRKRLFLVARRDGQPIVWPEATHGAPDTLAVRQKKLQPWRTAADCIDWSIPAPSIFERERPLSKPMGTITSKGDAALCVPTLIQTGYGERPGQAPRVPGLDKPLGTVVNGQKHALVAAFLAKHYTGVVGSDMADPLATVTSVDHHSLVTATIEHTHGRASGLQGTDQGGLAGGSAGRDHMEVGTSGQPAARDSHLPEASRAQEQERLSDGEDGVAGQGLSGRRAPGRLHSVGGADHAWHGLEPSGRGQGQQPPRQLGAGDARSEPSARASDRPSERFGSRGQGVDHSEEVRAFLTAYYGTDQDPQLQEPLHTVTTKDRFGLVMVKGEAYAIVDIGLRMLTPRELYRAQGFPESYQIDHGADGRPLTKTAQVRMCGNSVCPPLARALVAANYIESLALKEAA